MLRCSVAFVVGAAAMALAVWMCSGAPVGAAEPTGYTLKDVYDFIVSNGGTNPAAGGHSLYPADAPGTGGMPTISQIMAELRTRLPAQAGGGVLTATGQTKCYNTAGTVIDCGSADWPGQDGFYHKGCAMVGRFVDNGNGTVTDNCTGLMWQKETAPGTHTWQAALKYCEGLSLGGHGDWRLPNVRELQSIVDYGRSGPSMDPVFGAVSMSYWSSSTFVSFPVGAWIVDFCNGDGYGILKDDSYYIRAVRG